MASSPSPPDVAAVLRRYSSLTLRRLLSTFGGRQPSPSTPNSLDFIEIVSGFHEGCLPNMTRPRSHHLYERALEQYTQTVKLINAITPFISIVSNRTGVYASVPAHFTRELHKKLKINDPFSFNSLFTRLATSFQIIRGRPKPLFQYKFFDDMPLEILIIIVSHMDESTASIASRTCSGLRRLCEGRVGRTAYFCMRYDMRPLHRPSPCSRDELAMDIIRAMMRARARATASIATYKLNAYGRLPLEFVSFENEWETLWPPYISKFLMLPGNTDVGVFEQFYNSIVSLLACRPAVVHLRLVSLSLISRLISHIQFSPKITRLTLERLPGPRGVVPDSSKMHDIRQLDVGFHGTPQTHRNQWCLVAHFPNVHHLFAYVANPVEPAVHYPTIYNTFHWINDIETLHVQGSTNHILALATWLQTASSRSQNPGRLQRLKIHARAGIPHTEVLMLLDVLSRAHRRLRILVLEGLDCVPVTLVDTIRVQLPDLEGLSLVRRASGCQLENKLCIWEEPIYYYAEAMRGLNKLRHLEINVMYSPTSLSPSALDVLIASGYTRHPNAPRHHGTWVDIPGDSDTECFDDGASIAIPFAAACPALESFAVRADACFYSCRIERCPNGTFQFHKIHSAAPHDRFAAWNPLPGSTW